MQGSSASADGANVFTLSCLQKMAGVQDSCVSHLCSLTERCKQWEQRALYAESEVKSAEDVIKTMAEQYVEMEANYVSASDSDGFDDCGLSPDVIIEVVVTPLGAREAVVFAREGMVARVALIVSEVTVDTIRVTTTRALY